MKLFDCLDMAYACGLETVDEARHNIELHAPSLFTYATINNELLELYRELVDRDIKPSMTLQEALDIINQQDNTTLQFEE